MIYVDAYNNVITEGSKVKYLGDMYSNTIVDDIYIIDYMMGSFNQVCITSIRTGQPYLVYCSNVERVFEDPVEFIEVLPV